MVNESVPTETVTVPPGAGDQQWRIDYIESTGGCGDGRSIEFVRDGNVVAHENCAELPRNVLYEAINDGDWLTVGLIGLALLAIVIALVAAVYYMVRFIKRRSKTEAQIEEERE